MVSTLRFEPSYIPCSATCGRISESLYCWSPTISKSAWNWATKCWCFAKAESFKPDRPAKVFEQPVSVDVARLLGLYNLLPAEIQGLDPGRNVSRIRFRDFELTGPYFPGRLIGDQVWLCIRPDMLTAMPRDGHAFGNQMPATLVRVVEKLDRLRLEFAGDIAVEVPRSEFEKHRGVKDWLIEFPRSSLRIL